MVQKKLGIWMDHSTAHLMKFNAGSIETEIIESRLIDLENVKRLWKNVGRFMSYEKQQQWAYFSKLNEIIRDYKKIILFGPSDAKIELFDILSEDERCLKIKVEIQQADQMTENQEQAFVKEYFSSN